MNEPTTTKPCPDGRSRLSTDPATTERNQDWTRMIWNSNSPIPKQASKQPRKKSAGLNPDPTSPAARCIYSWHSFALSSTSQTCRMPVCMCVCTATPTATSSVVNHPPSESYDQSVNWAEPFAQEQCLSDRASEKEKRYTCSRVTVAARTIVSLLLVTCTERRLNWLPGGRSIA